MGGTTTEDPEYIVKYGSNFAGAHGDAVNPVRLLRAENRFNRTSDVEHYQFADSQYNTGLEVYQPFYL